MAAKKKAAQKKSVKKVEASRNMVPLYILIIMLLATALVMVLNSKGGRVSIPGLKAGVKDSAVTERSSEKKDEPAKEVTPAKPEESSAEKKKVKVYYLIYNDRTGKVSPWPVVKEVSGSDTLLAALNALVKGTDDAEGKKGLISSFPEGLTIRSAAVRNGIAEIDLSSEFSENAHGDILTGRLNQLFYTSMQFPGVKGITIRINGKPVNSIGGDGLVITWPMKKAL